MTAQVDENDPGDEADASAASRSVEDVGKRPKKLRKASKRVRERSKRKDQQNSSSRPREEPDDPGGETAVPGGVHSVQESPRMVSNERADETDAPRRYWPPGGCLELQGESEVIEGEPDPTNVVDHTGYDGKGPRSDGSERVVEMNAPCRENRPGGHIHQQNVHFL